MHHMTFQVNNIFSHGTDLCVDVAQMTNPQVEAAIEVLVSEAKYRGIRPACLEPPKPPAPALNEAEKALTETGRKIQAIKHLRDRSGCSLKDAKDAVDKYGARPDQAVAILRSTEWVALDDDGNVVTKPRSW